MDEFALRPEALKDRVWDISDVPMPQVECQLVSGADASAVALIFAIMTIATLVAMPIAVVAAHRLGTVSAYFASLIVSGAGLVVMASAQHQ